MAAKIYRINYKSDFILTLTSDAGWATPFCIKFWTGAPSVAYYAGWDGTIYTHCAYNPEEPTKLQVQFDDHHLPVGDLKFQIGYHFTVADFPNDTEDEVINPANITVEVNGEAYQVMLDFTGETAPEIEFALPAYANEQQRIANEQQRIVNEQQRIANEQQRIAAEDQRVTDFGVIEQQAQQVIGEAGSAAQAAYEAAGEAANVNAELDGTILTVTNRQGTSTSVNTKGEQGEQGNPGQAATISVGTTTTGAPGTSAQVTNSGTSSAAVLDFTIPQGAKGDKGDQGEPGEVTEAELTEKLATKANTDGYYSRMIVGGAESLIGDVPQTATYTFRRTGGGAIGEPVARLTEIQGNTGVVNQLNSAQSKIVTTTASSALIVSNEGERVSYIAGHKYLISAEFKTLTYTDDILFWSGQREALNVVDFVRKSYIKTPATDVTRTNVIAVRCNREQTTGGECGYRNLNVIDLTLEYGAGYEPGTVAEFEARIWRDYGKTLDEYIAYTQGKLINCKALSLENVGQNQWDEEWELGRWNPNTGDKFSTNSEIRSSNYIEVLPSTTYSLRDDKTIGSHCNLLFYDANKVYLGRSGGFVANVRTFTTPASCHYVTFYEDSAYGTTYKHDICINISDAAINGTYRPYKKDVVNLNLTTLTGINPTTGVRETIFPNGMRSNGDVRDVINGNTATVKIGDPTQEAPLENTVLATPIIYTNIQYPDGTPFVLPKNFEVQNGGTERITHAEGEDSIAPVMSAIYGLNAVGFVQDAPKDYTSQATLDGLVSLLSSLTGHSISKTWDAANNKWVFS